MKLNIKHRITQKINHKHRDTYLFAGIRSQCVLTKGKGEVKETI